MHITEEGDRMFQEVASGGLVWVSPKSPRWTDWRGRQAYKYRFGGGGAAANKARG